MSRSGSVSILVVIAGGCSGHGGGAAITVSPGPVATVTRGTLLQLSAQSSQPLELALALDADVAARFDTAKLSAVDGGAIVSLVPSCTSAVGFVAMAITAPGVPNVTLTVEIVNDPGGPCAGAQEHAITAARLQLAYVPAPDRVVCAKATELTPSVFDPTRAVAKLYDASGGAASGHLACGTTDMHVELWPPIDAPPLEQIQIDTIACATSGCDPNTSVSACCEAAMDRQTPLTSLTLSMPTRSVSEVFGSTINMECADLDGDGLPEIVLDNTHVTTAIVGTDGRLAGPQSSDRVTDFLALSWQAGTTTDSTPVLLGVRGANVVRAKRVGDAIQWMTDPAFQNVPTAALQARAIPIGPTANGGATYLVWLDGGVLNFACISTACAQSPVAPITIARIEIIGLADVDGQGGMDLVATIAPQMMAFGAHAVSVAAIVLTWNNGSITSATPTTIVDGASGLALQLVTPYGPNKLVSTPDPDPAVLCHRIYYTGGALVELTPMTCGSLAYKAALVSTIGDPLDIARIADRAVMATPLGVFSLTYDPTNPNARVWLQQDPLRAEHALVDGQTIVDDANSHYANVFAPCVASIGSSIAFQITRNNFEWTELDLPVQTFSPGTTP